VKMATPEAEKALMDRFRSDRPEIVKTAYGLFIRKGIPGSEQVFLDALERYGSYLADVLAFCGNKTLEDAGRAYYRENYFPNKPLERENSPKWGSGRQQ
jgi:hypothetical protein